MDNSAEERKPWEQLPDEPIVAYRRFLVYLYLGPGRSVEKAAEAQKGTKRHIGGAWKRDCSEYRWVERAAAYDIDSLSRVGSDVVVLWVRSIAKLAEMAYSEIEEGRHKPRNLEQLLEVIGVLGNFVTPETVQAAREFTRGNFGQPGEQDIESHNQD